jgi:hypothetical protein
MPRLLWEEQRIMEDYKEYDDVAGNVPVRSDFTAVPSNDEPGYLIPITGHNKQLAGNLAALPENLYQERATVLGKQSGFSLGRGKAGGYRDATHVGVSCTPNSPPRSAEVLAAIL